MFSSSGEGRAKSTLLGPMERSNLNHRILTRYIFVSYPNYFVQGQNLTISI
jgi:hypothetical protein